MIESVQYVLLADGPSDHCLVPIIDWLLTTVDATATARVYGQMADLRGLRTPPTELEKRIKLAMEFRPCDILFVHRDAERRPRQERVAEIRRAVEQTCVGLHVPIVPVRMTEAWLLTDEEAIRTAADNVQTRIGLDLPAVDKLEGLPNPKALLQELLEKASGKKGRHLRRVKSTMPSRMRRIAESTRDFSALGQLSAFRAFEEDTLSALRNLEESIGPNQKE